MKARELMVTTPVLTIRPDDDLALASQIMLWAGIRHLPVVRDGTLIGVLSERDILRHEAMTGAREGARSPVADAMSTPAEVVDIDADVAEAAARMLDREIGCLPVVHGERLLGIITSRDILGYEARRRFPPSTAQWPARARDIMTASPQVAREDDMLLDAVSRMVQYGVRHLPVVDGEDRAVGILSDRDVRTAIGDPTRAADRDQATDIRTMKVAHVMTSPALLAHADEALPMVARNFLQWRVGALPIVDEQEKVVGIISYLDLLDAVYSHFWDAAGKTAEEIRTSP